MKALVVGGTGFIGMNLVRELVARGHDVVATRRPGGNTLFARRLGARLVPVDLDQPELLAAAMRGREVVFLCAGHYPRYSLDRAREVAIARERARRALWAARAARIQRLVLTSSVALVGPPAPGRQLSDERDEADPASLRCVYHAVKAAIESEARLACYDGLDVVVLRPTAVFGELDVKAGTGFVVVAVGRQQLGFFVEGRVNVVDADDLARAHVRAAERGRRGEVYIAGGHNLTARALLETIAGTLDVPLRAHRLPPALAAGLCTLAELRARRSRGQRRETLPRELVDVVRHGRWVDVTKARTELGLKEPTPLEVTLKKACDWYLRHRYLRLAHHPPIQRREEHAEPIPTPGAAGSGAHHPAPSA